VGAFGVKQGHFAKFGRNPFHCNQPKFRVFL
jgi:hypothetical protein